MNFLFINSMTVSAIALRVATAISYPIRCSTATNMYLLPVDVCKITPKKSVEIVSKRKDIGKWSAVQYFGMGLCL